MEINNLDISYMSFSSYSEIYNWSFNLSNKYYSIKLKDIFQEPNTLYLDLSGNNWDKIYVENKNQFKHNFQIDGHSFCITQKFNKKFELFIDSLSFEYIKSELDKKNNNQLNPPTACFNKYNNNNSQENNNLNNGNNIKENNYDNKNNENLNYNNNDNFNNNHINNINNNKNNNNENNNNVNYNIINNFKQNIDDDKCEYKKAKKSSRNNKSNLQYQSSDELLKKAITKAKNSHRNNPEDFNNNNFRSSLPSFAQSLPKSIYHVYQYNNKNMSKECGICLDKFVIGQEILTLPCFHFFHCKCISEWLYKKPICPICNSTIFSI